MKRLISIIITLVIAIGLNSSSNNYQMVMGKNYLKDMNMNSYSVSSYELLSDFDNNTYLLYNFKPQGYAIFATSNMNFIEGSFATNSLYETFKEAKYYIGPYNYYIKSWTNDL